MMNWQTEYTYGQYKGEQDSTQQRFADYPQQDSHEKIYEQKPDRRNELRIMLALAALLTIIIIAILCTLSGAGAGGWIGFGLASIAIFVIAVVAIDKIQ